MQRLQEAELELRSNGHRRGARLDSFPSFPKVLAHASGSSSRFPFMGPGGGNFVNTQPFLGAVNRDGLREWRRGHVTLAEDASRIRVNPSIMARLRSQTLNIARANSVTNIAEALWAAALDPAISLSYRGL